jgi:hypothetical protein
VRDGEARAPLPHVAVEEEDQAMAKIKSKYRRVRKLPKQFKPLEAYDAECKRGLVHTPEYDQRMASLNDEFQRWVVSD